MFWLRIKKIIFSYALLSGGLFYINAKLAEKIMKCSMQSDQCHCYSLSEEYEILSCYMPNFNILASLSVGTASANSVKFCGIRPSMYIEDLL